MSLTDEHFTDKNGFSLQEITELKIDMTATDDLNDGLVRSQSKIAFTQTYSIATSESIATEGNWWMDGKVSKGSFGSYLLCAFVTVASFPFVAVNILSLLALKFSSFPRKDLQFALSLFVAIDQIISILVSSLWGFLSEKIGRRRCYALTLMIMATCVSSLIVAKSVYPSGVLQFFRSTLFIRGVFGVAAAGASVMFSTVLTDYCKNNQKSQGLLAGMAGLSAGLGATLSATALNYVGLKGHSYAMCYIMSGMLAVSAVVCFVWMRDAARRRDRRLCLRKNLMLGIVKLQVPEVCISCFSVFFCRGNNIIPLTFIDEQTVKSAYSMFSLLGLCIFAYFARKCDCLKLIMINTLMIIVGFLGMVCLDKTWIETVLACIAGIGQGGLTVVGMALLSSSVEMEERSALSSTFNLFGSFGILVAAVLGMTCKEGARYRFLGMIIPSCLHLLFFICVLGVSVVRRTEKSLEITQSDEDLVVSMAKVIR